jgi:hypothetical protein
VKKVKGESIKWTSLIFLFVISLSIVNTVHAPAATPLLYVDPPETAANPCESFDINITVADVVNLFSWAIKVSFDGNLLTVTSVTEGPFLKDQAGTTFFIKKIYSNYVDCADVSLTGLMASGSGVLMTITFHVEDAGCCALDIYEDTLIEKIGTDLVEIPHDTADGNFCTTAVANLVRKSAWPAHHHFVISKHGENQTLYGKVRNLGPIDLYVKVMFELVRDDGDVKTVETAEATVTPDAIMDLTATFGPLTGLNAGRYHASASCWYSHSGTYWSQGEKIKAFSFAVVA